MNFAERGLYRDLLDECWIKGSVPSTASKIADMLGVNEEEVSPLLRAVKPCFTVLKNGQMTSPFLDFVRSESDAYRLSRIPKRFKP